MGHRIVAVVLALHGVGHAVGFWMDVPAWFAVAWLLPGAVFLVGAWGCWRRHAWWPPVVVAAAVGSLLLLFAVPGALRLSPYGSAFLVNLAALVALMVPASRRRLVPR